MTRPAFNLDVSLDVKAMKRGLNRLERREIPKAASFALNRAAAKAKTEASKHIAKVTSLKSGQVKQAISIQKAGPFNLVAFVKAVGGKLNLKKFNATQTRKGVTAKVWGKRQLFKGAFIVNDRYVAKRIGRRRLPIKALFGPGVTHEFLKGVTVEMMKRFGAETFKKNFERDAQRRINRLRG